MNITNRILSISLLVIACVSCGKKKNNQSTSTISSDTDTSTVPVVEPGEDLFIHFFEMGETYADSFLIKYLNYEILVDGGTYSDGYTIANEIGNYCTDGVLDMLIATHPHADHTGGLSNDRVFTNIKEVRNIIDYGYTYNTSTNRGYESKRKKYIDGGAEYYPIYDIFNSNVHSPIFNIGPDAYIEFLNTNGYLQVGDVKDGEFNHNSASVVGVLHYKNIKYYFGGDIETAGETYIRQNYPGYFDNSYNIYKASHHGSNTSNGLNYVKYIAPKAVLVSSAIIEENRTEKGVIKTQHPYKAALNVFTRHTDKVYWNGTSGSYTVTINGVELTNFEGSGATHHYYHDGEIVDSDTEKNLPMTQTIWYEDYMKLR